MQARNQYFPALDTLRLLASINIVLHHFSTSSLLSYAKGTVFQPVIEGPVFNASMFFILSGFIYSIIFSNEGRHPKFKSFMKERFRRLYPLHIICTLIIFAIVFYRTSNLDNTAYAIKTLALHASLLWAFVPKLGHWLNQPSWTLSVFFLCYALTPAFSRFLNRQNKNFTLWIMFFATWGVLVLALLYFKQLPNVFRGIEFFSGMLLGKCFQRNAIPLPKAAWLNDLLLLLTAALLYINADFFRSVNAGFYHHIVSPLLYCLFLLLLANNKGFIVRIFSISWLRAIGKASFYTYLLHGVAIELLHLYLDKVLHWEKNIFNNPTATFAIMFALYGGCAVYNKLQAKK